MNNCAHSPRISIIVAVFNGVKTIQQCIDSIHSQTYGNVELIIIDGGSQDGTVDLLKKNNEKISYWISEKDKGIYNAWNKGVARASGDWISFLGADDYLWQSDVLEQVASELISLPSTVRYAYGEIMLINSSENAIHKVGLPWEIAASQFPKTMSVTHPGSMHRKELFVEYGYFDERFKIAGDYEFLLRELKTNSAFFMSFVIAGMRIDGISKNANHALLQLSEVRMAQQKHGYFFPSLTWIFSVIRVRIRLGLWRLLGEKRARRALDVGRRLMGQEPYWTRHN